MKSCIRDQRGYPNYFSSAQPLKQQLAGTYSPRLEPTRRVKAWGKWLDHQNGSCPSPNILDSIKFLNSFVNLLHYSSAHWLSTRPLLVSRNVIKQEGRGASQLLSIQPTFSNWCSAKNRSPSVSWIPRLGPCRRLTAWLFKVGFTKT